MDTAIIALVSVILTGVAVLITNCFQSMSLSRCTTIDCCCVHCIREVLDNDGREKMMDDINDK